MGTTVGFAVERITQEHVDATKDAKTLLEGGKIFRESRESVWRISERQYVGQQWSVEASEDPTADLTVVNISFATVQTIQPYITGQEPRFYVEPFSKDATQLNASLQEALLNRIWMHREVGAQQALRDATADYVIYGDGWIKVSWAIEEKATGLGQTSEVATIFVDRVSPWDVWIDPYASSVTDARWVAQRLWKTRHEVEGDDRYQIPADFEFSSRDWEDQEEGQQRTDRAVVEDDEWVVLVEFYDQEREVLYTFPDRAGVDDRPWQVVEGMSTPLVPIAGYLIPGSPYHMGDLEQIAELQQELNKTRSQLMTHRRRNIAKIFMKEEGISDDAQDALMSPIVGEIVPVATDRSLSDLVMPVQLAPIASENYAVTDQIMNDIREITGITEYQRGIAPDITRTATEASIMEGAANVKIKSKLSSIETATRQAGELILAIAAEVFPKTDVDEIAVWIGGEQARKLNDMQTGDQMADALDQNDMMRAGELSSQLGNMSEALITPRDDMFIGEYEVSVAQGSTEYRNPQAREQRYKDMFFSLLGVAEPLQQVGVQVDYNELLRLWLESTDVPDVDAVMGKSSVSQQMQPPGMPPEAMGPPGMGMGPGQGMGPGMGMGMGPGPGPGAGMGMMGAPGPQPGMPPPGMPGPDNTGMIPEAAPAGP